MAPSGCRRNAGCIKWLITYCGGINSATGFRRFPTISPAGAVTAAARPSFLRLGPDGTALAGRAASPLDQLVAILAVHVERIWFRLGEDTFAAVDEDTGRGPHGLAGTLY